jgi:hypothetical protein
MGPWRSLREIFDRHEGRLIHKWEHYFPVYEQHLAAFRRRPVKVLEIGIYHGGSLQMWKQYFGKKAAIVGVDINPQCAEYTEPGIEIEIGDQNDPGFWASVLEKHKRFDVIIDDGSHIAQHQIAAFSCLWPHLGHGGIYIVEDCHTAYLPKFGGGVRTGKSFIDFAKLKIDEMNALWASDEAALPPTRFTVELDAMMFYDSMVVFQKQLYKRPPVQITTGEFSRPVRDQEREELMSIHIKSRSKR